MDNVGVGIKWDASPYLSPSTLYVDNRGTFLRNKLTLFAILSLQKDFVIRC